MDKQYMPALMQSDLFRGFTQAEIEKVLACMDAKQIHTYKKGEIIFGEGDRVTSIYLVLSGQVDAIQEDYWGNQMLVGRMVPGDLFGESFVMAKDPSISFMTISVRQSTVLSLPYERTIHPCATACDCHHRLLENLLYNISVKTIILLRKMRYITQRTVREKILMYLSEQSTREKSNRFTIQLNRQALADYLGINRSSLSIELGRMQKEGILTYSKNTFELNHSEQVNRYVYPQNLQNQGEGTI